MKKHTVKAILGLLAFLMILSSCNGNTPVDTVTTGLTTAQVTESQTNQKEESNKPTYANMWTYKTTSAGVLVREITIDSGKGGDAIEIVQLSDLHINYFNQRDLDEANPALMSTMENRQWLKNFGSQTNINRCMEMFKNADQIVLTGDVIDSLSWGALEKLNSEIFQKYDNVMACLGNHDASRQNQGTVADTTTLESRLAIVQENWCNDVFYSSKVIGDKVMLIQMDNGSKYAFWDVQVDQLAADLATARANGYVVLIFYHIPLATANPYDKEVEALKVGDPNFAKRNFYNEGVGRYSEGASKAVYDLITNNGDIIKGTFCGHNHNDYYTEIKAKTASGEATVIPQYTLLGIPYNRGHALKITIT